MGLPNPRGPGGTPQGFGVGALLLSLVVGDDALHLVARAQDDGDAPDEDRFIAVGTGSVGVVMVVVYTLRGDEIRLISARCATRHEVRDYEG